MRKTESRRNAGQELVSSHPVNRNVIFVTEGTTDASAIEIALQCIYPHLAEYFTFFDFKAPRVRGGASSVVEIVKAFAAARIADRIVAFIDNDTAGEEAMRALANVSLPNNIRVLRYPPIEIASAYPTLGPTGLTSMNVNGLAGSIELYLGRDVP